MAEKETPIERMKRLAFTQNNIRNIATSAHIHHGKCISGSSRLILSDGSVRTAQEIFETIADSGNVYEDTEDHTIFSPQTPVSVFSYNQNAQKMEKKPIQHAWRLRGGKVITLTLRNGFAITTTPEHKYLRDNQGLEFVEAHDLRLGDRIVCSRKVSAECTYQIKEEILDRLSPRNFYVKLHSAEHLALKRRILDYGISKLTLSIKAQSFYHGILQNRYPLVDLMSVAKIFQLSKEHMYDSIDTIVYSTGKKRGHNSLPLKLPTDFEGFFYLAGLFFGDGLGKKCGVGKEELSLISIEICDNLGFVPKRRIHKIRTPELHTSTTLMNVLYCLFDYPLKNKSQTLRCSDFLHRSPDALVAKFLSGYYDTNGSVENTRSAVTMSSASSRMIDDLQLLLLRFGCIAMREKDHTLSLFGASALNFTKYIGFSHRAKQEKLRQICAKAQGSIVCDTVRVGTQFMLMNKKIEEIASTDIAFIEVKKIEAGLEEVVYDFTIPETHNFVAEGMVIHNTAFTDNLLAAAGLMSEKAAGDLDKGMATWQHKDEQERLMTVDSANVSMVHNFNNEEYLINLIDTPGHVDFGGNVTRAMRAIDGTVVLVCASEGIMPQTETVLKQALRERVKPVLFINKVDRLIKEMMFTPEQMQERFVKVILEFNQLIEQIAEPEFKQTWKVNIADGSVAFGSARDNWALSLSYMQKKGVSFKDILALYQMSDQEKEEWVWKNAPLHEVILDMVIKHLPNPAQAQKYRISKIWHGDLDSQMGQDLVNCNKDGKIAFVITRILMEPRSGREVSAGRLFSGTIKEGMTVYLNNAKISQRVAQVFMYQGIRAEIIGEVPAGNVLALAGISGYAGETITLEPEQPFDELKHIFEPVITKAILPASPADLSKLVEVLRKVGKEDPSVKIEINQETGENLMAGMGELHLEIIENRIVSEKGVKIKTSPPIVVYRETITKVSPEAEGKSPNKHNKFYFSVEPLPQVIADKIRASEIPEMRIKKKDLKLREKFLEGGFTTQQSDSVRDIYKGSIFLDGTKGQVHVGEVIEMILDMFEDVMNQGPLAREPCFAVMVKLTDMSLHEDAIHRGPAQVYPAVRDGIREAMMNANPLMFEPMQILLIEGPIDFTGDMSKLVSGKRGQLLDMNQDGGLTVIKAKMPVAEMLGWSSDLRSATGGRGNFSVIDQSFERMNPELSAKVIMQIRSRKGLKDSQVGV